PLAVRKRPAREDRHSLGGGEELPDEAALPHPRLPVDGEDVRPAVAHRPLERVVEKLDLRFAADERSRQAAEGAPAVADTDRTVRLDRLAEAAQLERPRRLRLDRALRQAMGGRAHQ